MHSKGSEKAGGEHAHVVLCKQASSLASFSPGGAILKPPRLQLSGRILFRNVDGKWSEQIRRAYNLCFCDLVTEQLCPPGGLEGYRLG